MNMKLTKEKLFNLLLVLISCFIALGIGEIAVRVFAPESKGEVFIKDNILDARIKPGGEFDERGWRNTEVLEDYDMVAIGDSQTFGAQAKIDKSWPAQLADISGKKVYQMAIGGYGAAHYSILTQEALELNPEIIIWGFYLGNDLFDSYRLVYESFASPSWRYFQDKNFIANVFKSRQHDKDKVSGPTIENVKSDLNFIMRARIFMRDQFYLYKLLGRATRKFRVAIGLVKEREEAEYYAKVFANKNPDISFYYDKPNIDTVFNSGHRFSFMDLNDPVIKEGLRITFKVIENTAELLKEKDIKFILVLLPSKEMVYRPLIDKDNFKVPKVYNDLIVNEEKLKQLIFAFCNDKKLYCLDVAPAMQENLIKGVTLYPHYHDSHPIAEGYKIYAESIYNFLKDNNLI